MRVRKLGSAALVWRGGTLEGGQEGDLPQEVVERYLHKLEVLDELPAPTPIEPNEVHGAEDETPFDAASLTVPEVLAAIAAGAVTVEAALASEEAGKARVTLLAELRERRDGADRD